MTKLLLFNILIAQWLFVRVAREVKDGKTIRWGLLVPVVPLTGFWFPYIPRRPRFWKLGSRF